MPSSRAAVAVPETAPTSTTAEPTEKVRIPIYFSIVTDGPLPGSNNLLHIQARFDDAVRFERNIRPQHPLRPGSGIGSELLTKLEQNAIPVRQAMEELIAWLDRFKGARIPVTSAMAFWHLIYHMHSVTSKMPFVSYPIDVNSYYAGAQGDVTKHKLPRGKDPWKAMEQRINIIRDAADGGGDSMDFLANW